MYHLWCVCELLTVKDQGLSVDIKFCLVMSALILQGMDSILEAIHRVPTLLDFIFSPIQVVVVVISVLAVSVDKGFNAGNALVNLTDFVTEAL